MMTRWTNAIGGAWVLAGALMFSIMNGFAKYLPLVDGPFISPLQTTMVRYCVALLVLLPFVLVRRSRLKTRHSGKYFIRTVAGLGGIALMFLAVTQIPLASATAIGFTSPIFAMIFALLLLRETVRKMRWVGATVGLIGAVIIVNPDGSTISFGALIAMLAAIFMGAEVVGVKWLSRTEDHAATIIFFSNAWGTGLALCLAAPVLTMPSLSQLTILVAIGLSAAIGQVCIIQASRKAEASFLAPFFYISLFYSAVIGFFVFDETVPLATLLGCAAILLGATINMFVSRDSSAQN